jgi:phenylacetate-coenzyme A ligase PaaK-like adenylate-forming protein
VPFSPYYKKVFADCGIDPMSIRDFDDLKQIPFTSKDDIAPTSDEPQRPREIVLQPTAELIKEHWPLSAKLPLLARKWLRGADSVRDKLAHEYRPVSVFFTTGRTALPTAFVLSRYDLQILEEVGRRIASVGGMDPSTDKVMNLFPYAPHLAFWQVFYVGIGSCVFMLNTGGGKVMGTEGILQAIQKIRPAYLVGVPGYVYHLLREAHSQGMDLSCIKTLALGGDRVTPGYRTRVKELLVSMGAESPRIGSVLGFTEARKCWSECSGEAEGGFHLYPDMEIVEIVDPDTGKPVGDGETGELVYTNIEGRGSTILRYKTGDLIIGGMTHEACPHCGRTVPRLGSQIERVSNLKNFQLSKLKGTLVNLNVFKEELDNDARVEEWQLVIKKRNDDPFDVDELHLNLALSERIEQGDYERVGEDIENRLLLATEVRVNHVHMLPLKQMLELLGMETQMKEKRIVDLRMADTPSGETVSK